LVFALFAAIAFSGVVSGKDNADQFISNFPEEFEAISLGPLDVF